MTPDTAARSARSTSSEAGQPLTPRAGWQRAADDMVTAALRFASPSGALIDIPGPRSVSGRRSTAHEGYARTFLAAGFRVGGAEGDDPAGLLERYAAGLAAGVNPAHPERWPTIEERRQSVVEAASIAIALHETRPWLWDRLDAAVQERTIDYLAGVVGTDGYTNNWTWFQTVTEHFLATVGGPWSQADLDRNEQIREDLYVGEGWYSDGASPAGRRQNFDYYAGWAWHLYPLLDSRIRGRELSLAHRERLAAYVGQAIDLIGSDGAPVFQGRSLTYRFALLAPFWAASLAGGGPLSVGATRRLADNVLGYFRAHGAFDERGLLRIGWHGEFLPLRQGYSGSGSPYWASKAFVGLLLPPDHPEWTAEASADEPPGLAQRAFHAPGWIVVNTPGDGVVRVINHGTDGDRRPGGPARADRPLYQRMGYSNVTSPDLTAEGIATPRESHTALLDRNGEPSHRGRVERVHLSDRIAVSRSRVHWLDLPGSQRTPHVETWAGERSGPTLTTASIVHGAAELRLAWWNAVSPLPFPAADDDADDAWPADPGPWRVAMTGWALPVSRGTEIDPASTSARRSDGLCSSLIGARRIIDGGVRLSSSANAFDECSATPWAHSRVVLAGEVVAATVTLSGDTDDAPTVTRIWMTGQTIVVEWRDGAVDHVPAEGAVAA